MGIQRLPILVFDYSLELEACRIAFFSLQVCWYLPLQTNTQHPAHLEFHSLNLKDDSFARQKMMDATPFPSKRTELKFLNSILNGHSKLIATHSPHNSLIFHASDSPTRTSSGHVFFSNLMILILTFG